MLIQIKYSEFIGLMYECLENFQWSFTTLVELKKIVAITKRWKVIESISK